MNTLIPFYICYIVILVKYLWDETIVEPEEEITELSDEEINEILFL